MHTVSSSLLQDHLAPSVPILDPVLQEHTAKASLDAVQNAPYERNYTPGRHVEGLRLPSTEVVF